MTYLRKLAGAIALVGAIAAMAAQAQATSSGSSHNPDHQWSTVGNSPNTRSTIKLGIVRTGDNALIEADGVLYATADMASDGMPNMTARIRRLPEADSTIHRVALDPIMAGRSALNLQAEPFGVSEPVQATLIVTLPDGPVAGAEPAKGHVAGQQALSDANNHRAGLGIPPDLRFELIGQPRQNGGIGKMHQADSESLVFVRLVRSADGSPVTNATVDLLRVDMAPDGMGEMTARSYIRPFGDPGTYRAEVHPLMAGQWGLTLAAQAGNQTVLAPQVLTVALAK
ncbi:FixH family protein [Lichenicoccus sp.]|uniref:FixH family protein n=1 Tax=Lichenicoccus sp. TaxID=2781899 RepID=UPI003D12E1B6